MKNMSKTMALTAMAVSGLGLSLSAVAADTQRTVVSNAIDKCQAFTPGVTNTIRNRVVGAQNIGNKPIAVACSFELPKVEGGDSPIVDELWVWVQNNDKTKPINVACTMLPGTNTQVGQQTEKSVAISSNAYGQVKWSAMSSQDAIGVVCSLPPQATMTQTGIVYHAVERQDDP